MTATVLFLCPHHAAKSVIAAAYFNRLAEQHGLSVVADSAGTEPDAAINPAVASLLLTEGIDVSQHQPRRVTSDELTRAYRVISMGCTAEELDIAPERVEQWADVPMVSKDLVGAQAAIRAHVEAMISELREKKPQ